MADKELLEEVVEDVVDQVEEKTEEKVGFFKNAKAAIKGKIDNFSDDHPKAAKALKTGAKVVTGGALLVGGIFLGNAIANKNEDDYPGFDDDYEFDNTDSEDVAE